MDESSGFFETPARARSLSDGSFELISSNSESYCDLWRADRDGRFRVYKSLKAKYMGDPVYERLLRKEFEIGYSLKHQNICEYYAFVSVPPLGSCIEMEWVDGETLDSLLSREKMSKTLAVRLLAEICDALGYMHSKQVVHRDLKPSNIMLTHNGGYVKLIDFGLSDSDSHSVLKGAAGTQIYASPELISGGEVDLRSDIYSLGCVIDRLCPPSPSLLGASSLRRIARKCTRRDPARRFQTALEVRRALLRKPTSAIASVVVVLLACIAALLVLRPWQNFDGERLASPSDVTSAGVSPSGGFSAGASSSADYSAGDSSSAVTSASISPSGATPDGASPSAVTPASISPSAAVSPAAAVPDSVQSAPSSAPTRAAATASGSAGSRSARGFKTGAVRSSASRAASSSTSRSGASSQPAGGSKSGATRSADGSKSGATTSDQAAIDEIFRQATDLFGE